MNADNLKTMLEKIARKENLVKALIEERKSYDYIKSLLLEN